MAVKAQSRLLGKSDSVELRANDAVNIVPGDHLCSLPLTAVELVNGLAHRVLFDCTNGATECEGRVVKFELEKSLILAENCDGALETVCVAGFNQSLDSAIRHRVKSAVINAHALRLEKQFEVGNVEVALHGLTCGDFLQRNLVL